jgi:DNA-binding CsgD family transcriptional regulator
VKPRPRGFQAASARASAATHLVQRDPPSGLGALTLRLGTGQMVIFSYPVPELHLPRELTRSEREVVLGVLRGRTNRQIARDRSTAPRTVANLLARVFRKLGVGSRAELVAALLTG